MNKKIKYATYCLVLPIIIVLALDRFLGKYVVDIINKSNELSRIERSKMETKYRIGNQIFHHTLAANFYGQAFWPTGKYNLCTDENGFKFSCEAKNSSTGKEFDIAFIGDSFTEGIGLPYEKTFVGLYQNDYPEKRVANLAVASYAPTIYYSKIKWLIDQGYKFKEIIVFPDISDMQDEAIFYDLKGDRVVEKTTLVDPNKMYSLVDEDTRLSQSFEKKICGFNLALICKILSDHNKNNASKNIHFNNEMPRSSWTYKKNEYGFGSIGQEGAINQALARMELLHELLKSHGIKMSLGVYPWPAQLLHDSEDSLQVRVWREFCRRKCERFYDTFPDFFEYKNKYGAVAAVNMLYFPGDIHLNELGNSTLEKSLKKYIINK